MWGSDMSGPGWNSSRPSIIRIRLSKGGRRTGLAACLCVTDPDNTFKTGDTFRGIAPFIPLLHLQWQKSVRKKYALSVIYFAGLRTDRYQTLSCRSTVSHEKKQGHEGPVFMCRPVNGLIFIVLLSERLQPELRFSFPEAPYGAHSVFPATLWLLPWLRQG